MNNTQALKAKKIKKRAVQNVPRIRIVRGRLTRFRSKRVKVNIKTIENARQAKKAGNTNAAFSTFGNVMTGTVRNALRYTVNLNPRGSTVVSIADKTVKSAKGYPIPFIRIDAGPKNFKMPHINVNPRVTGVADPHLAISSSALNAAKPAGRVLNVVNKVALPVAIAIDAYQLGKSANADYKNGSTRNTIETVASVTGAWTGGFGGGATGAAIGTAIFPGIGTFIGGLVGGIAGAIGVSTGAQAVTSEILERNNYDILEITCEKCGLIYKNRIYSGEKGNPCPNCESMMCKPETRKRKSRKMHLRKRQQNKEQKKHRIPRKRNSAHRCCQ